MNLGTSSPPKTFTEWRAEWLRLTGLAALAATAVDAALLERKKGFFTGGFLAVDHVRSPFEAVLFLSASLLADAAVVGILVALGLWLTARIQLTRTARSVAVLTLALGPLLIANLISYQLHEYLGDAFDIGLMFDLSGRSPGEFFAVGSSHLGAPMALIATASLGAVGIVWALNRFVPGAKTASGMRGGATAWRWTLGIFIAGLCSTAILRAGTDVMENGLRRKPAGKFLGAIAEVASDVDRDGFGAIARMNDPDPFDASIFPWAVDVPGNGIDENGLGGDLPPSSGADAVPSVVSTPWAFKPDIVLVVLESFRADVVGAALAGRPVTPTLNELAAAGVSSQMAFSHNGYTAQSRFHLFSGSLPPRRDGTTLIDDFQANGYEVAYFSGQDESFGGEEFSVGFKRADVSYDATVEPQRRYSTFSTAGSLAVPLDVVGERVNEFLSARHSTKPLLLYVNFHDTHFPYHHSGIQPLLSSTPLERGEIAPKYRDQLRMTYLNTAANVDRAVASVLESARLNLRAAPAVIVTSDHGESLFDDGFLGHGHALDDVQTRVPFVVSGLPLRLTEPFGQAELRESISAALATSPAGDSAPALTRAAGKRVFQYLGTIRRPRQIGFVTAGSERIIYDFGEGRVRMRDGEWRDPSTLAGAERAEFLDLVHSWERLAGTRAALR